MAEVVYVLTTTAGGAAAVAALRPLGPVTAVVVGPREVAEACAAAGPDTVLWCEPTDAVPAEAYAPATAALVARAAPRVVASGASPADRALLGAAAVATGAVLLPGARTVTSRDGHLVVERAAVGGAVLQTLETDGPLAIVVDRDEDSPATGSAPIEQVALDALPAVHATRSASASGASGLTEATRVVAVGRGLRARGDLELVTRLAEVLGAEVACSMPIADDLGWLDKSRYIGRSGQSITPRLYLTVGISGAPQHLEGVRGAKVVAAIDLDPDAPVFRRADYGIAGDLYEVVPALIEALTH